MQDSLHNRKEGYLHSGRELLDFTNDIGLARFNQKLSLPPHTHIPSEIVSFNIIGWKFASKIEKEIRLSHHGITLAKYVIDTTPGCLTE